MEHRWGQRQRVDLEVRLSCPYAIGPGRMVDVSISGAFIQTIVELPLLARVQVEMQLRTSHGTAARRVAAWVVRRNANGVGIEWQELAPVAVREILTAPRALIPECDGPLASTSVAQRAV